MKVLVFTHRLEVGGSQVNAVDLATAVRERHGHEFVFFGTPGPAVDLIADRGFRYIAAPAIRTSPSPTMVQAVRSVVRQERVDLVHAWDWQQCLDAFYGAQLACGVPVLGSISSMSVPWFLPPSLSVTFGTPELVDQARRHRRGLTALLEPPVNVTRDDPEVTDHHQFLAEHGVTAEEFVIVCVSRLAGWMKLDGLRRTVRAVDNLADDFPVRLFIVGDGDVADLLRRDAEEVNIRRGRCVITVTGLLLDPRPAYAAADVVVGMGGSILRGMAFGKPAIILGEQGFSESFTEETAAEFLYRGFFGVGDGHDGSDRLAGQLRRLITDSSERTACATYSKSLVRKRFALPVVADANEELYKAAVATSVPRARLAFEGGATLARRIGGRVLPESVRARLRPSR